MQHVPQFQPEPEGLQAAPQRAAQPDEEPARLNRRREGQETRLHLVQDQLSVVKPLGVVFGSILSKSESVAGTVIRCKTNRSTRKAHSKQGGTGFWTRFKYWYFIAKIIRLFDRDFKQFLAMRKVAV